VVQLEKIVDTAKKMMRLHGVRAQAIAQERAEEKRHQGDSADFEYWQHVNGAICELRREGAAHRVGKTDPVLLSGVVARADGSRLK
jgi:hypothetical protein